MSALPPKADIGTQPRDVRFVPKANIPESGGLRQRDDLIDVLFDGGVQRGTHILKAISLGAKAVGVGCNYLSLSPQLAKGGSNAL
jgi:isopentenyl diphosphate isomerase/L-lactate dehydrogenase-like FMN-dependent dehydrogenase